MASPTGRPTSPRSEHGIVGRRAELVVGWPVSGQGWCARIGRLGLGGGNDPLDRAGRTSLGFPRLRPPAALAENLVKKPRSLTLITWMAAGGERAAKPAVTDLPSVAARSLGRLTARSTARAESSAPDGGHENAETRISVHDPSTRALCSSGCLGNYECCQNADSARLGAASIGRVIPCR
jgi:hypothetical protein